MNAVLQFMCDVCEELYHDEYEAESCCQHTTKVYICQECFEEYYFEAEAMECCGGQSSPASLAELEAAGQLRIFE